MLEKFNQLKLPLKETYEYFLIQFGCISKKTSAPESLEMMTENKKNVDLPNNKHQTSTTPPEKIILKKTHGKIPTPFTPGKHLTMLNQQTCFFEDDVPVQVADF